MQKHPAKLKLAQNPKEPLNRENTSKLFYCPKIIEVTECFYLRDSLSPLSLPFNNDGVRTRVIYDRVLR